MYKLKVPQPYASLLVSGTVRTLLADINIDKGLRIGETIFVYATDFPATFDGINTEIPIDRKVFNEIFLGNLPDNIEDYPINTFVGHVSVAQFSNLCNVKSKHCRATIPINSIHKFKKVINEFNTSFEVLNSTVSQRSNPKKIRLVKDTLIVPVGREAWSDIHNPSTVQNLYLFSELDMPEIVSKECKIFEQLSDFTLDIEVDYVQFQYWNKRIKFTTNWGCRVVRAKFKTSQNPVDILDFNIQMIDEGNCCAPLECLRDYPEYKRLFKEDDEYQNPYVKIIYTPMGGLNKWRR